jgi:2'-5' RNA ligase
MIYALVHYPNIDTWHINEFRRRHDPQVELIEPHITVMFPVPESIGEEKLISHLAGILMSWQSFPIHLQGCQIAGDDYLYLLIQEGKTNIIRMHNKVYTEILTNYLRKELPFIPHLTLGVVNKNVTNRDQVLREAEQLGIDYHCLLDKLQLVKVSDDRSKIVWSKEFLLAK